MSDVQEYIYQLNGNQKIASSYLNDWFIHEFNLQDKLRYKIPFYFQHSWLCYMNPIINDGIELVFLHGQKLSNDQGLLDPKNRKMVAGISIFNVKEIPLKALQEVMHEALLLDELMAKGKSGNKIT